MKKALRIFFIMGVLLCLTGDVSAQCAMCKTTAESDLQSGGSIANGLNTGILYLMAIPYLILMTGGYFFFRKQIDARLKSLKNKYFPTK